MIHILTLLAVALTAALIFYPKHVGLAWARFWGFVSELFEGAGDRVREWREARRAEPAAVHLMAGLGGPAESAAARPPTPNPLKAVSGVTSLIWRHKRIVLMLLIALLAWRILAPVVSFVTCPFGGAVYCFDERQRQGNAEVREARGNQIAAEHERDVAVYAGERALETNRVERRVERVVEQGQEDIQHAVSAADFDALHDAYARAYGSVWDDLGAGDADSAPDGPRDVRPAGGDNA